MQYKIQNGLDGTPCSVAIVGKLISIPFDPANTDYQAFLTWCAEGNEPLPADEGEQTDGGT
jgi:hypothetical protein